MTTITLPLLLVEIERANGEVITTKVPEHELTVLKVVHGESSVRVADEGTDEEIELDAGADAEFRRLQRKDRRINAPDLVARAFPMGPGQLKDAGFKSGGDTKGPAQSASRTRPAKKARKPEKKAEAK